MSVKERSINWWNNLKQIEKAKFTTKYYPSWTFEMVDMSESSMQKIFVSEYLNKS